MASLEHIAAGKRAEVRINEPSTSSHDNIGIDVPQPRLRHQRARTWIQSWNLVENIQWSIPLLRMTGWSSRTKAPQVVVLGSPLCDIICVFFGMSAVFLEPVGTSAYLHSSSFLPELNEQSNWLCQLDVMQSVMLLLLRWCLASTCAFPVRRRVRPRSTRTQTSTVDSGFHFLVMGTHKVEQ